MNNAALYVTVPVYNERNTKDVLESLANCLDPGVLVQVDVFINASESDAEEIHQQNASTYAELSLWFKKQQQRFINFRIDLDNDIPEKLAGVGYARKFLMDRAAAELRSSHPTDGIISCLDADCRVEPNYLLELLRHFKENTQSRACSVYFEHPIEGDKYPAEIYQSITYYELYLRYYKNALQFTGHPHWYFTVGSSMAVRVQAYLSQGGMNRRKAGEDFYFLQKLMSTGDFSELNSTTVFPSPRISSRVPFGTGMAVSKIVRRMAEEMDFHYETYSFESFEVLKHFFDCVPEFYRGNFDEIQRIFQQMPRVLQAFLEMNQFMERIESINNNSRSLESFTKGFYNWFNPFKVLKFIHFARDNAFPNKPITNEILKWARQSLKAEVPLSFNTPGEFLDWLREIDRSTVRY